MDMQRCSVCGKRFDFEKGGLESSKGWHACGSECAKSLAKKRGNYYAIHNKEDDTVDSNLH